MDLDAPALIVVGAGQQAVVGNQVVLDQQALVRDVVPGAEARDAAVMDVASPHDVPPLHPDPAQGPPLAAQVNADGVGVADLAVLDDPVRPRGRADRPALGRRDGDAVPRMEHVQPRHADIAQPPQHRREDLLSRGDLEGLALRRLVPGQAHVKRAAAVRHPEGVLRAAQLLEVADLGERLAVQEELAAA